MIIGALLKRKLALLGLIVIAVFALAAILAPWIAPYDPTVTPLPDDPMAFPQPPDAQFWLGTDLLGRDLLSRLIYGARATLVVGIVANGIALAIGALVGITAGYLKGPAGNMLMGFKDLMMTFPVLLLGILLAAITSPGLWKVAIIIAMVSWVQVARVVYSETISLAEREYVTAVRATGAGTPRILFRHILPHLIPTLIVWGTLGIATTSLLEAVLSYLGVGVQPPTPSWGNMVYENQTYFESAPWLVFIPSFCITLLALAFNLIGDALRDILDPTMRGRH